MCVTTANMVVPGLTVYATVNRTRKTGCCSSLKSVLIDKGEPPNWGALGLGQDRG